VANAASVSIDQGIGNVAATGSTTINPASNITYTLTARGPGGTVQQALPIKFATPQITFTANSASNLTIAQYTHITLQWTYSYATSLSLTPLTDPALQQAFDTNPPGGYCTLNVNPSLNLSECYFA